MIITSYKYKPAQGLTHSIGAKQISDILKDVEIYNDLSISFDKEKGRRMGVFAPGFSLHQMKGESKELLDFRVIISGIYSHRSNWWNINLKPIEKMKSKHIKEFLINTGLPHLKNWFEMKRFETWFAGERYYQIGLNEDLTKYCIWETYNDKTIDKKIEKITVPNNGS